jgi:hypothetical protein
MRQIAASASEPPSVTRLTSYFSNWLQTFSTDSSLAVNLLVTLLEIVCGSRAKLRGHTLQRPPPCPNLCSADARIANDLAFRHKYTPSFSASKFKLTSHFNPLGVHANLSDPQNGVFFGNYGRKFRGELDVFF